MIKKVTIMQPVQFQEQSLIVESLQFRRAAKIACPQSSESRSEATLMIYIYIRIC